MADDNADAAPVLKKADLGTRSHRCNARPINPFESAETPSQEILAEVFESSGWKRDASHKCANQDKIMASLTELGPESPYVTAIDEATGITGIHAAAVNGYTDLLKAFMDLGQVSFYAPSYTYTYIPPRHPLTPRPPPSPPHPRLTPSSSALDSPPRSPG